jgi:GDPmannose 4,6-dehydratase
VTGITGQDGGYLAELLKAEGCEVVGVVRPGSQAAEGHASTVEADLADHESLRAAVLELAPHEVYHLAAPTFVPASWDDPAATMDQVSGATAALLGACRDLPEPPRVFVATSAEMFGATDRSPQDESAAMRPRSPYGAAKLAAHLLVGAMRDTDGLHATSGILYNHESPRRPERFVTRKISRGAASIALGLQDELVLGDLRAVRDWSHARDVMRGALLAVRHEQPGDYVFASGVGHTVGDFVDAAFAAAGVDPAGQVRVDPALVRPPEPTPLVGDPARAREVLGWAPEVGFEELVAEMVAADLDDLRSTAGLSARAARDPRAS